MHNMRTRAARSHVPVGRGSASGHKRLLTERGSAPCAVQWANLRKRGPRRALVAEDRAAVDAVRIRRALAGACRAAAGEHRALARGARKAGRRLANASRRAGPRAGLIDGRVARLGIVGLRDGTRRPSREPPSASEAAATTCPSRQEILRQGTPGTLKVWPGSDAPPPGVETLVVLDYDCPCCRKRCVLFAGAARPPWWCGTSTSPLASRVALPWLYAPLAPCASKPLRCVARPSASTLVDLMPARAAAAAARPAHRACSTVAFTCRKSVFGAHRPPCSSLKVTIWTLSRGDGRWPSCRNRSRANDAPARRLGGWRAAPGRAVPPPEWREVQCSSSSVSPGECCAAATDSLSAAGVVAVCRRRAS